jgi:hypothetical protein
MTVPQLFLSVLGFILFTPPLVHRTTHSAALRTPDAGVTWEALQTRSLAGSNLVNPGYDALRLSRLSQGAPV